MALPPHIKIEITLATGETASGILFDCQRDGEQVRLLLTDGDTEAIAHYLSTHPDSTDILIVERAA